MHRVEVFLRDGGWLWQRLDRDYRVIRRSDTIYTSAREAVADARRRHRDLPESAFFIRDRQGGTQHAARFLWTRGWFRLARRLPYRAQRELAVYRDDHLAEAIGSWTFGGFLVLWVLITPLAVPFAVLVDLASLGAQWIRGSARRAKARAARKKT